jgi:hypothetical protein
MKNIFLFCFILSINFSFGQKDKLLIEKFIDAEFKQNYSNYLLDSIYIIDSADIVSYFSKFKEFANIKTIKSSTYVLWNEFAFANIKIIKSDSLFDKTGWRGIREKYPDGFYEYSSPLFNKKKNAMIIYKSYISGPLSGCAEILLYIKSKKGWKIKKVLKREIR